MKERFLDHLSQLVARSKAGWVEHGQAEKNARKCSICISQSGNESVKVQSLNTGAD